MANNKIQLSNGDVLLDLTGDSVTPDTLLEGATAHNAAGEPIVGALTIDNSLGLTGATVGQIAKITAVDAEGRPTRWGPVDMPSDGGGEIWEKIADVGLTKDKSSYEIANFGAYRKVKILMSRATYVSGLNKNVWFRIRTASQPGTGLAQLYMAGEYGYRAWEIDAEVGDLFMRMTKITANNFNSPSVPVITVADLSPQNPAEYGLYIDFTDVSVIQDGDTVAVYGVSR